MRTMVLEYWLTKLGHVWAVWGRMQLDVPAPCFAYGRLIHPAFLFETARDRPHGSSRSTERGEHGSTHTQLMGVSADLGGLKPCTHVFYKKNMLTYFLYRDSIGTIFWIIYHSCHWQFSVAFVPFALWTVVISLCLGRFPLGTSPHSYCFLSMVPSGSIWRIDVPCPQSNGSKWNIYYSKIWWTNLWNQGLRTNWNYRFSTIQYWMVVRNIFSILWKSPSQWIFFFSEGYSYGLLPGIS